MHSKAPGPTKEQQARFKRLYEIGCIACRKRGVRSEAQIHHLLKGHYRAGHSWTIPLCVFHHTGEGWPGYTMSTLIPVYGEPGPPGRYKFKQEHGLELDLLDEVNEILEKLER